MKTKKKTCCFFGHRKISDAENLKTKLYEIMEQLILHSNVDTFLMGSKSDFDSLCRKVLENLKEKYPHIKRIYVRAEYPYITDDYQSYLLESCEETYYPERVRNAGKAIYVKRNFEMIDKSDICIVYYKYDYVPSKIKNSVYKQKSGTGIAYHYAERKNKTIINVFE